MSNLHRRGTSAEALNAAMVDLIQVDAQRLQEFVCSVVPADSCHAQEVVGTAKSLYKIEDRTLTFFADRIAPGKEKQACVEALVYHLGERVASDLLGPHAVEEHAARVREIGYPPGLKSGDFIQCANHFGDVFFEVTHCRPPVDDGYWRVEYVQYDKYADKPTKESINSPGSIRAVIPAEMAVPTMLAKHQRFHSAQGQYDPFHGFAPVGTPLRVKHSTAPRVDESPRPSI